MDGPTSGYRLGEPELVGGEAGGGGPVGEQVPSTSSNTNVRGGSRSTPWATNRISRIPSLRLIHRSKTIASRRLASCSASAGHLSSQRARSASVGIMRAGHGPELRFCQTRWAVDPTNSSRSMLNRSVLDSLDSGGPSSLRVACGFSTGGYGPLGVVLSPFRPASHSLRVRGVWRV